MPRGTDLPMSASESWNVAWVKALAILAWADGKLDQQEIRRLTVNAVSIAGMDFDKIERVFDEAKDLAKDAEAISREIEPIARTPIPEGLRYLRQCYELAMADGLEDPAEVRVIEQIAGRILPADRVPRVIPWLRAVRAATMLENELLPAPGRLPAKP